MLRVRVVVVVGDDDRGAGVRPVNCKRGQALLIRLCEAGGAVARKPGCCGQGNIRRVAIDDIPGLRLHHGGRERLRGKGNLLGLVVKITHFRFGKIWLRIATKGHIKRPARIVAAKPIVSVTIQIDEERSFLDRICSAVEANAPIVVNFGCVANRREELSDSAR